MKVNLQTVLAALPAIVPYLPPPYGAAVGGSIELARLISELIASDPEGDGATIEAAIASLAAENDEGHVRYQRLLAEAALKG